MWYAVFPSKNSDPAGGVQVGELLDGPSFLGDSSQPHGGQIWGSKCWGVRGNWPFPKISQNPSASQLAEDLGKKYYLGNTWSGTRSRTHLRSWDLGLLGSGSIGLGQKGIFWPLFGGFLGSRGLGPGILVNLVNF